MVQLVWVDKRAIAAPMTAPWPGGSDALPVVLASMIERVARLHREPDLEAQLQIPDSLSASVSAFGMTGV
jgi:hypothetical protein